MTQFSLADDTMAIVDAHALASNDLKSQAPAEDNQTETSAPAQPEDNQCEDDAEAMTDAPTELTPISKSDRHIAFSTADVIEFEPTLWTATVASDGVPVGLSSTVRRRMRRRLDSLEGERLLHRVNRQEYMEHGYLEPEERVDMLEAAGHSLAIMSEVERYSMRVNRERWESNEYDLLYQFGLGEEAIMDLDEEDELLLSQGGLAGYHLPQDQDEPVVIEDEDDEMLEEDDDEGNPAEYYYYTNRTTPVPADDERRSAFAMDEMDSYDTRKYEEWAWDYTTDCILGDDSDTYSKDGSFDLPSLDFGLPEMSSSPTDVTGSGESLIVSCGKIIGSGSPSPSTSSGKVSSPRLFI